MVELATLWAGVAARASRRSWTCLMLALSSFHAPSTKIMFQVPWNVFLTGPSGVESSEITVTATVVVSPDCAEIVTDGVCTERVVAKALTQLS